MYACNGIWTAFSDELPPDDAYDEGTLTPLYTHPANITDEKIDSVIHELRQKSFDPKRWVDVYTIAIETIIQLRNELRKAQEK